MNKNVKKFSSALSAGVVVASALVGAVGWDLMDSPEVVVEQLEVVKLVEVKGDDVIQYVDRDVVQEVVVEKLVDNEDLAFVLERLEDKDIIEDAEEIVEELKMEDSFINGGFDFIKSELKDLFDKLEDANIVEDEDEVEFVKVYDDFEDVNVTESDFDENEFKGLFELKVEDLEAESKHKVQVELSFEDGEFEIESVSEV